MTYNNLIFFDSESNELNLTYDLTTDLWEGVCYLPRVSTGLYETLSLYILEKVQGELGNEKFVTPISDVTQVFFDYEFNVGYDISEDIFLYSTYSKDGNVFVQKDSKKTTQLADSSQKIGFNQASGLNIVNSSATSVPLSCNIAMMSEIEGYHTNVLSIFSYTDQNNRTLIANIRIYGETEAEDERLNVLLSNIGMEFDNSDFFIFKDTNINELSPDNIILNAKRKELLLQASQIKPFVGTYKALLNAIDFYGYNKLTLKEYWLNINEQSEYFGKLKAVAVPNQDVTGFLANKNQNNQLPSSNQKKTSRFSLVYRLNNATGNVDEWDIPTVEEAFDYSPDEVLIKLYGLKNKLQKNFLPLQAKIVDITGEGDYFSQFNQNVWNNQHIIKKQTSGVDVDFKKYPEQRQLFIEDLRKVDYRLTGINQDFLQTNNRVEEHILVSPNYSIIDGYANNRLTIYGADLSGQISTTYSYMYDGNVFNRAKVISVTYDGENTIIDTDEEILSTEASMSPSTFTIFNNVAEILTESIANFYGDYYDGDLSTFNTVAGIPIGCPVVLNIESYKDKWDDAEFTWMDSGKKYSGFDMYNFYEDFPAHPTNPSLNYYDYLKSNEDYEFLTWENWWHANIYEVEWVISGPNNYLKEFRGSIESYSTFPITLPFAGDYSIELNLYDLYNFKSTYRKKDYINVKNKNVEVYGIYQELAEKKSWNLYKNKWDSAGSDWNTSSENEIEVDDVLATYYLTLDRANYIQDDQFGREFSTVRRFIDANSITGFSETTGPYVFDELKEHLWNDGSKISWDMTRIGADINSSFKINLNGGENGHFMFIQHDNPITNESIDDIYQIVSPMPVDNTDVDAWFLIAEELQNLDPTEHPLFAKFNYNVIGVDSDNNISTGETTMGYDRCDYMLIVAIEPSRSYEYTSVGFNNPLCGEVVANSEIHFKSYNPNFNNLKMIRSHERVNLLNHVTFSYDTTKMPGIVSQNWRLKNNTLNVDDIYYNNQWLTYLFKYRGEYEIQLELIDLNGNKNIINKNIIKII